MRPHLRNSVLPVSVELLLLKHLGCVSIPSLWLLILVRGRCSKGKIWGNGRFHWGCSIQLSCFVTVNSKKRSLSFASLETLGHRQCLLLTSTPSAPALNRYPELNSLTYFLGEPPSHSWFSFWEQASLSWGWEEGNGNCWINHVSDNGLYYLPLPLQHFPHCVIVIYAIVSSKI